MSDSEMTDLADQVDEMEVPLTTQSEAQRKRDDEVDSLLGTDMAGLAKQVMDVEIAQVPPRPSPPSKSHDHEDPDTPSSPRSPLAIGQWISESEDDGRTPEEDAEVLEMALRQLEEERAKSRAKEAKKRNYGRVGRSGEVAKLVIRGGRPRKVEDDSKVHADRRASQAPKEAYRKRMPPLEPVADFNWEPSDYEAMQLRRGSHWSTEAVADFARDERDMYACFR